MNFNIEKSVTPTYKITCSHKGEKYEFLIGMGFGDAEDNEWCFYDNEAGCELVICKTQEELSNFLIALGKIGEELKVNKCSTKNK